jgi:single-strand DNA-binding protein
MMNRLKVIAIGRLGKDPKVFATANGKGASFSIATSERWRDKSTGERREKTTWTDVTVYSPGLVKMIENGNLKQGQFVQIEGTLGRSKSEKDGVKYDNTYILLNAPSHGIDFLDQPRPKDKDMAGPQENSDSHQGFSHDLDDEIPF